MKWKTAFLGFLESPYALVVALVLPLLLSLEAVGFGIAADDLLQRYKLLGWKDLPGGYGELEGMLSGSPLTEMFRFFPGNEEQNSRLVELGLLPWWSLPEASGSFLRPFTALTHMLDYRLFPDKFWLQHLHSFAWAAAGIASVGFLYRRVFTGRAVASLALLAFALEDAHAIPTAWLANRNGWIALTFGALAIARHVRGDRGPPGFWAPMLFGLSLL